jgi:hypothetical protein
MISPELRDQAGAHPPRAGFQQAANHFLSCSHKFLLFLGWIWLDLVGFGWIWLDLVGFGRIDLDWEGPSQANGLAGAGAGCGQANNQTGCIGADAA